ncbi:cytochrome c, diheme subunit of cytochrome bc complex peta [Pseudoalteromonas phenolica]|uniref:Cytochrome c, diheme subunit of cytochrome bc complex peta n=1 Tax=Pseudoalteromonas phenolica TaxID=161398 RepID=A0A4Q7IJA3_9GAMM|nr:c-type cytochrome [Pseudoalteromonas phenolica]RZQ51286.1 cytochrome c, diheme subunit of cytochrome bc complex peta [Pseudoalteromonas phenolica]
MSKISNGLLASALITITLLSNMAFSQERDRRSPPRKLTAEQSRVAASNYQKYCALCHGENREGHKNDHAPSLRSKSLMESGIAHQILRPMQYGREGTAMGGYLNEVGGPMTLAETWNLTYWLFEQAGYDRLKFSTNPVLGDIKRGEKVFQEICASCHGKQGEGITGPALMNQSALAHNTDEFIRYAIQEGRQGTPMQAFKNTLSAADIDNITAFLRSKSMGLVEEKPVLRALPEPKDYIVNKHGDDPNFDLKDGMYVLSKDLNDALNAKKKMVLLDTRVTSVWQTAHIEGAIPFPYYADLDETVAGIPKDVQIVAYCSCPRAAADHTINRLRARGYTRTAVLWEGIFGWMHLGYPVRRGDIAGVND